MYLPSVLLAALAPFTAALPSLSPRAEAPHTCGKYYQKVSSPEANVPAFNFLGGGKSCNAFKDAGSDANTFVVRFDDAQCMWCDLYK